ncbi:MAG: YbjQ family protein [Sumerlaeia bacterium]
MILATTETVPGYKTLSYVGLVKGCAVRGAHAGDGIVARMKNALGGEVHEYTRVFAQTREQALDRLIEDARLMGANAVVGIKFCTSEIGDGVAELMAYGTAVIVEAGDAGH